MIFRNPAWLGLLAGIPLLLLIYLLRPQYVRKTVSSNYLWRLSEQYRQKRTRLRVDRRLLQLILQMLTVLTLALLAAGTSLRLPDADREMILILDTSASMNSRAGEATALEAAKTSMLETVRSRALGSSVTLLLAGGGEEGPQVLTDRVENTSRLAELIQGITPGWRKDGWQSAVAMAQGMLSERPGAQVELYTDHRFERTEHISIADLPRAAEDNAAIVSMDCADSEGGTTFYTTVISYGMDRDLALGLYLDGRLVFAQMAHCDRDVENTVIWPLGDAGEWSMARVAFPLEDALPEDNERYLTNPRELARKVLLTGTHTFYLENAFRALGAGVTLTVEENWREDLTGYDLYVFCGIAPRRIPQDGAVWLIDPPGMPEETGVTLGERMRGARLSAPQETVDGHVRALLSGIRPERMAVLSFRAAETWENGEPVLLCGAYPVALTGQSSTGYRWLATLFDLRHSNAPLLTDFVIGVRNALEDMAPPLVASLSAAVGEEITATVAPDTVQVLLEGQDSAASELAWEGTSCRLTLPAPGIYTLTNVGSHTSRAVHLTAHVAPEESRPAGTEPLLSLSRSAREQPVGDGWDMSLALAALLALLLLTEYGVYLYDR